MRYPHPFTAAGYLALREGIMRHLRTIAVAVALLIPSSGAAEPISFQVSGGELEVVFGLAPFQVSDGVTSQDTIELVHGTANLLSGPLLDIDVDVVNGTTGYTYGPGLLELTLTADSFDVTGTFLAPTESFSFVVCEGCDTLFGDSNADDFAIGLGPGLFDQDLADLLHLDPHTLGGFIDFGLEDINGDPSSNLRSGFDHRGYANLEIDAVEAPEPAALLLMLAAGAGWMARRQNC